MRSMQVTEDEAYTAIATAVVRQAVNDYHHLYQKYLEDGIITPELTRLERWFTSRRGQLFTLGLGEIILEKIKNGESVFDDEEELTDESNETI